LAIILFGIIPSGINVYVELINPDDGKVGAEGVITYFTFPPEIAREKLNYPDPEDFFE